MADMGERMRVGGEKAHTCATQFISGGHMIEVDEGHTQIMARERVY